MIERVLCPVDFSDVSRRALGYAIAIARWYRSHLTVMFVQPMPVAIAAVAALGTGAPASFAASSAERMAIRRQLEELCLDEAAGDLSFEVAVNEGNVADEILAEAEAADLVVVGTHGRTGVERLVLGSVAQAVLERAPCSVMAVPPASPSADGAVPALFHHIVAAVDFSDASLDALDSALSLAQESDAHLTLIHATPSPTDVERRRLSSLVSGAARTYCHVEERVQTGEPDSAILSVAAARHAQLIVLGMRRMGPFGRLLSGSVTERVVRQADCPVIAIRHSATPRRTEVLHVHE